MAKMWAGRTDGRTDAIADDFNSSIRVDSRMYRQDIRGSIAHVAMLFRKGILTEEEAENLKLGLESILSDLNSGALEVDFNAEDIHMFIEQILTERLGDVGKKLHTARSRNDQVALDLRMYLRDEINDLLHLLETLTGEVADQADKGKNLILPGYTHLQRAQPVLFGHHLAAYCWMFLRDMERMRDCLHRMDVSPIGCCALAGTTYDTDREYEAELLGFPAICENSMDGVSDRDFCLEFLSAASILMMHLSRFSEELVLWSSWEFHFIELDDAFTTGSSIMPQKKNPDMAELVRGKTGRVYGDLVSMLTVMKGLPLAYNKDMQEDKEHVFDACDTLRICLEVFIPMVRSMKTCPENMLNAAKRGFINATDLADYLTRKGIPFRDAYKISGSAVSYCIRNGIVLEEIPLDVFHSFSDLIEEDVYTEISLETCVKKRISLGGTSPESVDYQIRQIREKLKENKE